jgi:Right handed beta helix region
MARGSGTARLALVAGLGCVSLLAGVAALSDPDPTPVAPRPAPPAPTPSEPACTVEATPATLADSFAAASAGEVICLATGRYGTFAGAPRAGRVTIRAQEGATPRMKLDFREASNLTLDGLTIPVARLTGVTRDITIRNSAFTGPLSIDGLVDANVLLERNTHLDIDAPDGSGPPARIHLSYSAPRPSGVTVRDSLLAGGDADGIQTGVGLEVVGNEFRDIVEHGPNHTDAIQLIGARGAVLRGNYIHDSSTGIVAYDGVERVLIEDNVIDLPSRAWGIELYADEASIVRHNTLKPGACDGNLPCGIIELNRKPEDAAGRDTVVTDNVASDISLQNGSAVGARHHNLLGAGTALDGDLRGSPRFAEGADPTTYDGFRLATGSPGKDAASDGGDIGIAP